MSATMWLAAQDDHVGGFDAPNILILEDCDASGLVLLYREFDALSGLGTSDAGNEVGGCSLRGSIGGGCCGAGVRIGWRWY